MKEENEANVVLFNIGNYLTTDEKKEKEHIYSDALVVRKSGSKYLLTIHGDVTVERHDTIDGNIDYVSGHDDIHCSKGMYKINAFEAKILSKMSPDSMIFKGTLNMIRKRQNLMDVDLGHDNKDTEEARMMRDTILEKDRTLALSKQAEYGVSWKKQKTAEEKSAKEQDKQTKKRNGLELTNMLEKFTNKR